MATTVAEPFGSNGRPSWMTAGAMVADQEPRAGVGATVMGCNMFGAGPASGARIGLDGLVGRGPPFHAPVFVSPATPASRWRWRAAPPSSSSPTLPRPPSSRSGRPRAAGMSCWPAGPASSSSTWPPGWSMSSGCTWSRSCLVPARGCWRTSATSTSSRYAQSRRPASPTSSTASSTAARGRPTERRPFRRQARQKPPFHGCARTATQCCAAHSRRAPAPPG
jgi:hypothetical protein